MSQPKFKVKRGDYVQVMVGRYKGKRGLIEKVFLDSGKVLVEGVNEVTRHQKPSQAHPDGKVEKHLPIDISNVAIFDQEANSVAKVGIRVENGKRVRYFKKTGRLV